MKRVLVILVLFLFSAVSLFSDGSLWNYVGSNDLDGAVEAAERGDDPLDVLYLANLYLLKGDMLRYTTLNFDYYKDISNNHDLYATALKICEEYPFSYVYSFFGVLLWENNRKSESISFFEEALKLDGNNPFANNYYSMVFYDSDDRKYLEYALKAIDEKSDFSEAYNNASLAYYKLGMRQEAVTTLVEGIIQSSNPHPNSYYNLLYLIGEDGIAIKYRDGSHTLEANLAVNEEGLKQIHGILKPYPLKYKRMISTLVNLADYYEADYLLGLAEKEGMDLSGNYFRSQIAMLNSNYPLAQEMAYASFDETEDSQELYEMGNMLLNMNLIEESTRFYIKALEHLDPLNHLAGMQINCNLGTAYMRAEDFEKGIFYLEKGLEHNPFDTISLSNLGYNYKMKGDLEKSQIYFERALNSTNDEDHKAHIREIMNME